MQPDQWLATLAKLNVYRARGGLAPHKPLLLLVVLDLAEDGMLPTDVLELTPALAFRFGTWWSIVAHRRTQGADVRFPFFHLQSERFWTSLASDGQPAPDPKHAQLAALNPDFVARAHDPTFRENARRILITMYFPREEHAALYEMVGLPPPADDASAPLVDLVLAEAARLRGREARFRVAVVGAYSYTCALTGYRLTTIAAGSIVDAAHIHQFSDSRNNEITNGLALSKNAHWLFDNGLWTLDDD